MTAPLISCNELQSLLRTGAQPVLPCDCSFDLADLAAGRRAFDAAHLPGAAYFDLDRDLAAPRTGRNGRHALPDRAAFAACVAAAGADDHTLLVAYDGALGIYAARLWRLVQWAGHRPVRVLDGGIDAWRAAGGATESGPAPLRLPGTFTLRPPRMATIDYEQLREGLGRGRRLIVDARAAYRFRGENETLDPVAGHIPGAVNRWYRANTGDDGRFKPAAQLRAEWLALLGGRTPAELVHQCGSGVTACHNLVAMATAGLPGSVLYAGSWSEWCAQPEAPLALGD